MARLKDKDKALLLTERLAKLLRRQEVHRGIELVLLVPQSFCRPDRIFKGGNLEVLQELYSFCRCVLGHIFSLGAGGWLVVGHYVS